MMKYLIVALFFMVSSMALAVPTIKTVQEISETPFTQANVTVDSVNGDRFYNPNGDVFLVLNNPGASAGDFVIASQALSVDVPGYGPVVKSNLTVTVAAGVTKIVGPFAKRAWNNSDGYLTVTYSGAGAATLAIKAYRLKPSLLN